MTTSTLERRQDFTGGHQMMTLGGLHDQAGQVDDPHAAAVEGHRHDCGVLVDVEDVGGAGAQAGSVGVGDVVDVPGADLQRRELEVTGDVVDVGAARRAGLLGAGRATELVLDDEEVTLAEDRVVDSREAQEGQTTRRRRECLGCARRFTTYERIEEIPYMVVKKDGRRETFDRRKLIVGLQRACEKRPVPAKALTALVDEIEQFVQDSTDREVEARAIGKRVMERLKELDKVAYVRFASVYRQFEDVQEFMAELRDLLETRKEERGGHR